MKKRLLLAAAVAGVCAAILAGCSTKNENAEYYTLNKCDDSSVKLVDVAVAAPWSYDKEYSTSKKDMYLDHEDGGYIYICNEAQYEPLYTYLSSYVAGESVPSDTREYFEDNGYYDYKIDVDVIGRAFDNSDCLLIEESYTYDDGRNEEDRECTYMAFQYSDDGYIEFLIVDFYNLDTRRWTDDDYLDLARELFGR